MLHAERFDGLQPLLRIGRGKLREIHHALHRRAQQRVRLRGIQVAFQRAHRFAGGIEHRRTVIETENGLHFLRVRVRPQRDRNFQIVRSVEEKDATFLPEPQQLSDLGIPGVSERLHEYGLRLGIIECGSLRDDFARCRGADGGAEAECDKKEDAEHRDGGNGHRWGRAPTGEPAPNANDRLFPGMTTCLQSSA